MVTLYVSILILLINILAYVHPDQRVQTEAKGCPHLSVSPQCKATIVKGGKSGEGDFNEIGSVIKTWLVTIPAFSRIVRCQEDGHYNLTGYCLYEDYQTRCKTDTFMSTDHLILSPNKSTILAGRLLSLRCDSGFVQEGPTSIFCKANNTWSDKRIPKCRGCPYPGPLDNGYFTDDNGRNYNSGDKATGKILTGHCHENYTLQRNETITCLRNGTWSNSGPSCVPVTCKQPKNFRLNGWYDFADSTVSTSREIQIGDKLILVCKEGYCSSKNDYAICQKEGTLFYGTGNGCRKGNCTNLEEDKRGQVNEVNIEENDRTNNDIIIGAVSGVVSVIIVVTSVVMFFYFRKRRHVEASRPKREDNINDGYLTVVRETFETSYDELYYAIPEKGTTSGATSVSP